MSEGTVQVIELILSILLAVISPGGLIFVWWRLHARVKDSEIKIQQQKQDAERREHEHKLEVERLRIQMEAKRDDTQGQNLREALQMFASLQQTFQQQAQEQTLAIREHSAAILKIDPALTANAKTVADAVQDTIEITKARTDAVKANTQAVEKQTITIEALLHSNAEFSKQLSDVAAQNREAFKVEIAPLSKALGDQAAAIDGSKHDVLGKLSLIMEMLRDLNTTLPKREEISAEFTKVQQQLGSVVSLLMLSEGKQAV